MNEVIVSLQQKLENMKTLVPTEAATPEQISKYFNENEEIIAGILKAADSQTTATGRYTQERTAPINPLH